MLELADLKPGEKLYDLGSGDGRILITAVVRFKAKAVGVEISDDLVNSTNTRIRRLGLDNDAQVIHGNFLDVDLSPADVVTLYLATDANEMLRPNLEKYLKKRRARGFARVRDSGVEAETGGQRSRESRSRHLSVRDAAQKEVVRRSCIRRCRRRSERHRHPDPAPALPGLRRQSRLRARNPEPRRTSGERAWSPAPGWGCARNTSARWATTSAALFSSKACARAASTWTTSKSARTARTRPPIS